MNTTQQLVANKLPTRTWNHLNVNEATIPWNVAETADLGTDAYEITAENQAQPLHIRLSGSSLETGLAKPLTIMTSTSATRQPSAESATTRSSTS